MKEIRNKKDMSVNCDASPENNFCICGDNIDYVQYNANGLSTGQGAGSRCCNIISFTPDILQRLPNMNSPISTVSQFLSHFNDLEFTTCDYTRYFGGKTAGTVDADNYISENYPSLFTYADRQRIIYNNFYLYRDNFYPPSVTVSQDLVPVISGNTISTPQDTLPLVLNYFDGVRKESQYLFIVWPVGMDFPDLGFPYTLFYFYDINGNDCKSNYCTTLYSPYRGLSFSNIGPGNTDSLLVSGGTNLNTSIALVIIIILIIVILGGLLIWDVTKYKKKPIQERRFYKPPPSPRVGGV